MSKSILVIDTPECCVECEIVRTSACRKWSMKNLHTLPEDCPLKDAPQKINENGTYTDAEYFRAQGWNACIDEILKEVFENPTEYNWDNIGGID